MVFLKPLLSFLVNLEQFFIGPKTEVPCVIPVKVRRGEEKRLDHKRK